MRDKNVIINVLIFPYDEDQENIILYFFLWFVDGIWILFCFSLIISDVIRYSWKFLIGGGELLKNKANSITNLLSFLLINFVLYENDRDVISLVYEVTKHSLFVN